MVIYYLGEHVMYQDETLICEDCGCEFVFTAGEQEFYAEKGLTNKPKRCANCRKAKKQQHRGKKKMYDAVCAKCGKQTQVPFNPTQGRDVLCKECFDAEKAASAV
jgi:hypothetical protein